jgi:UrcA family protein
MLKQLIIASFALATVAAVPAAAQAQTSDVLSVTVSYAGIDANSPGGAQILLRRISSAAEKVCGGEPSNALDRSMKFRPCVQEVTQRTVAGMNNPRLSALVNKSAPTSKVASR